MEKKENKTMKKGLTIAALALLLGIVGYTGGNTFAKYVQKVDPASQTATIASWGFTATLNADKLFSSQYGDVTADLAKVTATDDETLVVKAATDDVRNVVAPGTSGEMTYTVSGQAEVDFVITFESKMVGIAYNEYEPVKWTVEYGTEKSENLTAKELNNYFKTFKIDHDAGDGEISESLKISWKWDFDNGNDEADTQLGLGNGTVKNMKVYLAATVTQTQNGSIPTK